MLRMELASHFVCIYTVLFVCLCMPLLNSFKVLLILSSQFFLWSFILMSILEFAESIVDLAWNVEKFLLLHSLKLLLDLISCWTRFKYLNCSFLYSLKSLRLIIWKIEWIDRVILVLKTIWDIILRTFNYLFFSDRFLAVRILRASYWCWYWVISALFFCKVSSN